MSDSQEDMHVEPAEAAPQGVEASEPVLTASQVKAMFASEQKALKAEIAELKAALKPKSEPDKEPSRTAQLEATLKRLTDEREAEKSAARDLKLQSTVKDALVSGNVPASRIKAAMAILVHADKSVGYSEDGQLVFRSQYGEEDLESGIKSWLKSEEGKDFQAPKGANGSGDRTYRGGSNTHGEKPVDAIDLLLGLHQNGQL